MEKYTLIQLEMLSDTISQRIVNCDTRSEKHLSILLHIVDNEIYNRNFIKKVIIHSLDSILHNITQQ